MQEGFFEIQIKEVLSPGLGELLLRSLLICLRIDVALVSCCVPSLGRGTWGDDWRQVWVTAHKCASSALEGCDAGGIL